MVEDPRRTAIDRFRAAAAADPLVAAAFLGGSFASRSADEYSDLDLYVVTEPADYDGFFARRGEFVAAWGDPVFIDTSVDFEGFGFDMLHFVLRDGVFGELALGHRGNMLALHGGPYELLVDTAGLLEGVTFPLYEPSRQERRTGIERALSWFWLDAIALATALARQRLADAQLRLGSMRSRCRTLADAAGASDARVLSSYVQAEPAAIIAAAESLIELHRKAGATAAEAHGLPYPDELANVALGRLHRAES